MPRWIVKFLVFQAGDDAGELAVSDAAKGAVVAKAAGAHLVIELLGPGVADGGIAGHGKAGVAEAWVAGVAHGDAMRAPGLEGNWRGAGLRA